MHISPDLDPQFLETEFGKMLVEIIRNDDQWADPEKQMLACHIYRDSGRVRQALPKLIDRLELCRPEVGEVLLTQLESVAEQLAETREQIADLQARETTLEQSLSQTRSQLIQHESTRNQYRGGIVSGTLPQNLLRALLAEEIAAAQL